MTDPSVTRTWNAAQAAFRGLIRQRLVDAAARGGYSEDEVFTVAWPHLADTVAGLLVDETPRPPDSDLRGALYRTGKRDGETTERLRIHEAALDLVAVNMSADDVLDWLFGLLGDGRAGPASDMRHWPAVERYIAEAVEAERARCLEVMRDQAASYRDRAIHASYPAVGNQMLSYAGVVDQAADLLEAKTSEETP